MNPLQSLIATGTKLWLDSVDPDLVRRDRAIGATGATSNPIIVADLVASGRYDDFIVRAVDEGLTGPADRLAVDRSPGPHRPGGVSARLGANPWQRRLRQF